MSGADGSSDATVSSSKLPAARVWYDKAASALLFLDNSAVDASLAPGWIDEGTVSAARQDALNDSAKSAVAVKLFSADAGLRRRRRVLRGMATFFEASGSLAEWLSATGFLGCWLLVAGAHRAV